MIGEMGNPLSRQFRRQSIVAGAWIFVGALCLGQETGSPSREPESRLRRPNILLILTDDQGWSQVSGRMDPLIPESGSEYLETPHMARLMEEGMRFTSGYAAAPVCTPARRSLLCGTTAARSGTEFRSPWIPAEHLTIPRALTALETGYRCAHFGKWGEQMESSPEECGYHVSDGMTGNKAGGTPATLGSKTAAHFIDDEDPKLTRSTTARAIEFMGAQVEAAVPFFVQISYYAPHASVVCRAETLTRFKDKGRPDRAYSSAWAAMLNELDQGVGELLDALESLGIQEETYVIFTSDNGGRASVSGERTRAKRLPTNSPLTGDKHDLAEGGIRVPFIVRGPDVAPGSVCRIPVAGYDLLPTFHELAGGDPADLPDEIDGVSLVPLFHMQPEIEFERPQGGLFFHRPARTTAGQWPRAQSSMIRDGLKLTVVWDRAGEVESRTLHALDSNPREDEEHDIADAEPGIADELQAELVAYLKSVNARMPAGAKAK